MICLLEVRFFMQGRYMPAAVWSTGSYFDGRAIQLCFWYCTIFSSPLLLLNYIVHIKFFNTLLQGWATTGVLAYIDRIYINLQLTGKSHLILQLEVIKLVYYSLSGSCFLHLFTLSVKLPWKHVRQHFTARSAKVHGPRPLFVNSLARSFVNVSYKSFWTSPLLPFYRKKYHNSVHDCCLSCQVVLNQHPLKLINHMN